MEHAVVTSLGNAGFLVGAAGKAVLIDPLFQGFPWVGTKQWKGVDAIAKADLILITHDHWDHFNAKEVAEAAERTGASVVGPRPVARALKKAVPADALLEMEPAEAEWGGRPHSARAEVNGLTVTAFRTFHGQAHNSYLVECAGFRFFHDGDNEKTQGLDRSALRSLDSLMLCPWQGAGWVEFVEAIRPRYWFLMHMTEEELDQQARGVFFRDLCDRVPLPERIVSLRPGESKAVGGTDGTL